MNYRELLETSGYKIIKEQYVCGKYDVIASGKHYTWVLTEVEDEKFKGIKIPVEQTDTLISICVKDSMESGCVTYGLTAYGLYKSTKFGSNIHVVFSGESINLKHINNDAGNYEKSDSTENTHYDSKLYGWSIFYKIIGVINLIIGCISLFSEVPYISSIAFSTYIIYGIVSFLISTILVWLDNIENYHNDMIKINQGTDNG